MVEHHPAQRLLLLWPPRGDAGPPARWPQRAWLLGGASLQDATDLQLAQAALPLLPGDASLWLLRDQTEIDWALGAELVLHHTPTLPAFQVAGLRAFIDGERATAFVRINDGYHQPTPGGPVVVR